MGRQKNEAMAMEWPHNLLSEMFGQRAPVDLPEDITETIDYVLDEMKPREQAAIRHRYQEDMTFSQIASVFGVSTASASNTTNKALRKLRHPSRADRIKLGNSAYTTKRNDEIEAARKEYEASESAQRLAEIAKLKDIHLEVGEKNAREIIAYVQKHNSQDVRHLSLPTRVYSLLLHHNLYTVTKLCKHDTKALRNYKGIGIKSVEFIKTALSDHNITLKAE